MQLIITIIMVQKRQTITGKVRSYCVHTYEIIAIGNYRTYVYSYFLYNIYNASIMCIHYVHMLKYKIFKFMFDCYFSI